jgi:uncharacterized protein (DUF1810 family)
LFGAPPGAAQMFRAVLDCYYDGEPDHATLKLLAEP